MRSGVITFGFVVMLMISSSEDVIAQNYPMGISQQEKLYGLSMLWQEVNCKFASHEKMSMIDWDSLYMAYIPFVIKSPNDYDYYTLLQRFAASAGDANTYVTIPSSLMDSILSPPIVIREIRGRFYVTNVDRRLAGRLPVGSEVVRINGFEIRSFLQSEVLPYISSGTAHHRMANALERLLDGWINTTLLMNYVTPDGRIRNEMFTRERHARVQWVRPGPDEKPVTLEWLNRETALISFNRIDEDVISGFPNSRQIGRATSIVIDLRNCNNYTSVGVVAELASRFADTSFLIFPGFSSRKPPFMFAEAGEVITEAGKTVKSSLFAYHKPDTLFFTHSPESINHPLIVLTGPGTGNSAEHLLMMLRQSPGKITTIGEQTAGNMGTPLMTPLSGGGKLFVLARFDMYDYDPPVSIFGIEPDIAVVPDIKSLLNGEDVVLEKAKEIVSIK